MKLALKVFDEKVLVALDHFAVQTNKDFRGTQFFISLVIKLWRILNVKSSDKGLRKRDPDLAPITEVTDERLLFVNKVHEWLCRWEGLKQKPRNGCLTSETFSALKHTVKTFTELVPYLITSLGLKFVLTGKFQTYCLEGRFVS